MGFFWGGGQGFFPTFLKKCCIFYLGYLISKLKNFRADRNAKDRASLQPSEIVGRLRILESQRSRFQCWSCHLFFPCSFMDLLTIDSMSTFGIDWNLPPAVV